MQRPAEEVFAEKFAVKPEKQPRDSLQGVPTLRKNAKAQIMLIKVPTKLLQCHTKNMRNPGACAYLTTDQVSKTCAPSC